jgi:predicted nucleic acid-binding protein
MGKQPRGKVISMTVELLPEDEKLVEERLLSGAFRSVGELIHRALVSLPAAEPALAEPIEPAKNLVELFADSPLKGLDLNLERDHDERLLDVVDSLLAATATQHNLTVVTRNGRHFFGVGVTVLNPWDEA